MATTKQTPSEESPEPRRGQFRFSVEPGAKLQITLEVGEKDESGKVPVTVNVEEVFEEKAQGKKTDSVVATSSRSVFEAIKRRIRSYDLATWLFIFAIGVYLVTRLIGLTHFPIYFFTDEAIQTQSIVDLVNNKYRSATQILFPTYFRNGEYYNLSLSVYLQWVPYLLFGKSALVTRATSVLVTLIAAFSIGIILREIFKLKYWWAGTLFLSITPAWFLHSRTAFETVEFVAFYSGALCAYLLYRYRSSRFLYLALFLGACAFYTYSPAQVIVPLTAIGLLLSDWRYHWEKRRTIGKGLALAILLALPYIRFILSRPDVPVEHLRTLGSYWLTDQPLSAKITHYFSEYAIGLSPWYWYVPNIRDLSRHLMKDYGHIMIGTLPFAVLGLASALRNVRQSAYRTVLIAWLISPSATALVQTGITRALVFVVPAGILTAIGFEKVLDWIKDPGGRLSDLSLGSGPTTRRAAAGFFLLWTGIILAWIVQKGVDKIVLIAIAVVLSLWVSGIAEHLAKQLVNRSVVRALGRWHPAQAIVALLAMIILSVANVRMLNDALRNGPLWFTDYGMGGMQYGAFQIFDILKDYIHEHPATRVIFSPDWANGTDVVARFFLGEPLPIEIGSIRGHIDQKLPLDDTILFVITPEEYKVASESPKFAGLHVERTVPYPDGSPGFYFVRTHYVDNIDEVFAVENAARLVPQESTVLIDEEQVKLRYSHLDSDTPDKSIALVFDNDPYTLAKTLESNPFVIEMTFPSPRKVNGFSIIIGSAAAELTLKFYLEPGAEPVIYTFRGQGALDHPELSFDLPKPAEAKILQLEMHDPLSTENAQIHIWELKLR